MKKSESEYKWLWQAPQTETLATISGGQAHFPQGIKIMVPQPNLQTGKKTWVLGNSTHLLQLYYWKKMYYIKFKSQSKASSFQQRGEDPVSLSYSLTVEV